MSAKKIALCGTFEVDNYGDHLFPAIFARACQELRGEVTVELFSPGQGADAFDGGPIHALDELGSLQGQFDGFVIGGGDIVRFDPSPHSDLADVLVNAHAKLLLLPTLCASLSGKAVAWNAPGVPMSVGPGYRLVLEQILQATRYLSVRDPASGERLGFHGNEIPVAPDSAFLLSRYFPREQLAPVQMDLRQRLSLRGDYITFHASPSTTCKSEFAAAEQHIRRVAEALSLPLLLLPLGPVHGEREFLASLREIHPDKFQLVEGKLHPLEIASLIAHARLHIGTGLHGHITAAAYGVSSAVIDTFGLNKLEEFGRLTGQTVWRRWGDLSAWAEQIEWAAPPRKEAIATVQEGILQHFQKMLGALLDHRPAHRLESGSFMAIVAGMLEAQRAMSPGHDDAELRRIAADWEEKYRAFIRDAELNFAKMAERSRRDLIAAEQSADRLEGECLKLRLDLDLEAVHRRNLERENTRLAQALVLQTQLAERMRRSWVWMPWKPFRWLEREVRKARKSIAKSVFPGEARASDSLVPLAEKADVNRSDREPAANEGPEKPAKILDGEYERWFQLYGDMLATGLPLHRSPTARGVEPLISILTPVYNTPHRLLLRMIESVRNQSYPHWELCLADDASTDPEVRKFLQDAAKADERIHVVTRARNGHISEASNSALQIASGEFCALLDHDDELAPHALREVVETIGRHPVVNLIYSDYDRIDEDGSHSRGYFKPDWNPDLLLSQNYICHLAVYRTEILREIGGFRRGLEGSQDWDVALRFSERCEPTQILHIPKVLYHWRRHEKSVSYNIEATHYAVTAAKRAVVEHLARKNREAEVIDTQYNGWFRVRYAMRTEPRVTIIICTRDRGELLSRCVESILTKTEYSNYEILIVDNDSREPEALDLLESFKNHPRVAVIHERGDFNFSALNNCAVRKTTSDVVCFLNNDTEVISADWLKEMVSHAVREEVGVVGPKLLYPDGRLQHAGVVLGIGGFAGHVFTGLPGASDGYMGRAQLLQNYTAVTGACMVLRRSVFLEAGGFNEIDLKITFNDIDLCLKIHEAGYRNVWTPFAQLYHHEAASRGADSTFEQKERALAEALYFRNRWRELIYDDPAYNPNLSLVGAGFALAFPPRNRALRESSRRGVMPREFPPNPASAKE